jgi:hypothetical protein
MMCNQSTLNWKTRIGMDRIESRHLTTRHDTFTNILNWTVIYSIRRGRRNRWPVASIFTVGPVKLNKDRAAGPVDILGPLGPATFVSSVLFNID